MANFNGNSFLSPGGTLASDSDNSAFSETPGILTFSNAVNLNVATATLDVQLNGTTAGSGYDQVVIAGSGSFSNNNANLKLTFGLHPCRRQQVHHCSSAGHGFGHQCRHLCVVECVATDLSQGATFTDPVTGKQLRISYRAEGTTFDAGEGLGNDIMLESVAAAGEELTWRGDVNNVWDIAGIANGAPPAVPPPPSPTVTSPRSTTPARTTCRLTSSPT